MATLGLVMIVKNEAAVIRRCLDSVRPLIDYVLISDTGSADGTQDLIRGWLVENHLPGEVIERPWRDFAHNRTEALEALRQVAGVEYAITIDADERLIYEPGFSAQNFKAALPSAEVHQLMSHAGDTRYRRSQIFSNRLPFTYRYALHEKLIAPRGSSMALVHGFHNLVAHDGARSRNPRKYLDDAAVIERAIADASDPAEIARYTFYLAQSYRDAGDPQRALEAYRRRAAMGFSGEETGVSLLQAGAAMERLGMPPDAIIGTYVEAHGVMPRRAEPLCYAARVCRSAEAWERGYQFALAGLALPMPEGLFVNASVYAWRMLDEFRILAHWTGRYDEAVEASERLLDEGKFPETQRERIERNAALALAAYDVSLRPPHTQSLEI